MNDPQRHHLLDQIAAEAIPDDYDRREEILSHIKDENMSQKRFISTLARAAIALFALLAMSTAAYALYQTTTHSPGIQGAKDSGLITPIDQSVTIGDATVTLNWAYADPLRLAVNVTAEGIDENASYGLFKYRGLVLADADGNEFSYSSAYGDNNDGDPVSEWTFEFYPQAVQITGDKPEDYVLWNDYFYSYHDTLPETLPMTLSLIFGGDPDIPLPPDAQPVPEVGPFEFEFEVNVQIADAKKFDVNQTVTANDLHITVTQVQIQASQTDVTLCYERPSEEGWILADVTLQRGENTGLLSGYGLAGGVDTLQNPQLCYEFRFSMFNDGTADELIVNVGSMQLDFMEGPTEDWEAMAEILGEQGIEARATFSQGENGGGGAGIEIISAPEDVDMSEAFMTARETLLERRGRLIRGPWEFTIPIP